MRQGAVSLLGDNRPSRGALTGYGRTVSLSNAMTFTLCAVSVNPQD